MAGFLNIYGICCAVATSAALVLGYLVHYGLAKIETHVVVGVLAPLASILGLCILMFYFIATGTAVRDVAKAGLIAVEKYAETRMFKSRLFPLIMVAIVFLMLTPITGAAFGANKLPLFVHTLAGWGAVAVYIFTVVKGINFLWLNMLVLNEASEASGQVKKKEEKSG